MNRWTLTDDVKEEYYEVVENFLNKLESLTTEQIENMDNDEFTIDLSDTKLRPYTLLELMREFGFGDAEFDDNGWELDYWIRISREGSNNNTTSSMYIHGTGMTFELNLTSAEFM